MNPENLFSPIPTLLAQEWVQTIARGRGVTVERIVSQGHCSAEDFWYDQDRDEWVVILQGSADLEVAGQDEIIKLNKGDHLLIPAHVKHRVARTSGEQQTIWLAVHFEAMDRPAS